MNDCEARTCSYYWHYLAQAKPGEANLPHGLFHVAEGKCTKAQETLRRWMETHDAPPDPKRSHVGRYLWEEAERWERKVRA